MATLVLKLYAGQVSGQTYKAATMLPPLESIIILYMYITTTSSLIGLSSLHVCGGSDSAYYSCNQSVLRVKLYVQRNNMATN